MQREIYLHKVYAPLYLRTFQDVFSATRYNTLTKIVDKRSLWKAHSGVYQAERAAVKYNRKVPIYSTSVFL